MKSIGNKQTLVIPLRSSLCCWQGPVQKYLPERNMTSHKGVRPCCSWSQSEAHPKCGITLQPSPQETGTCQSGQEQPQLSGSGSWNLYSSLLQNACAFSGPVDYVPKIFFALIWCICMRAYGYRWTDTHTDFVWHYLRNLDGCLPE